MVDYPVQYNTIWLSDHRNTGTSKYRGDSEVRINLYSLVPITAAMNSNFSKVSALMGATRVLEMMSKGSPSLTNIGYSSISFLASVYEYVYFL